MPFTILSLLKMHFNQFMQREANGHLCKQIKNDIPAAGAEIPFGQQE
jgi:hypothetical protein